MTNFPILTGSVTSQGAKQRLLAAIDALMGAKDAGGIANTVFKDSAQTVNRAADDLFSKLKFAALTRDLPPAVSDLYYSTIYMHTVAGLLKKVEKIAGTHGMVDAVLPLLREVQPLAQAIATIKAEGLAQKRQPKPVEDRRAKYQAPRASLGAVGVVKGLLEEITEGARDSLKDFFFNRYMGYLTLFMKEQTKRNGEGKSLNTTQMFRDRRSKFFNIDADEAVGLVVYSTGYDAKLRGDVYAPVQDHVERLTKLAASKAEMVRENFVYKNLEKLDSIVSAKSDLVKGEILGREISLGGLRGTLRFTFADGAAFTVDNFVKWNTSVHGKVFQQFPLTFHDAVLADGTKISHPSEEKMNTVFVGAEG